MLEETFGQYKGKAELINAPNTTTQDDLLTVYVISDHHLGLYAWAEETGTDYDTAIASKVLREAMAELVSVAPASRHALILNLGDFFHSDNDENRTRRSGNALDVDTRYARVLKVGVELKIATIEYALQRHMYVETRDLQGNHDPYAALALQVATQQFFRSNPRVVVHVDPAPFYWKEFGKVLIGSTHGDMAKPIDMPGIMAAKQAEAWGRTQHRYIYIGHTHQKQVGGGEKAGAQWEVFRCLAAKDAWANAKGYVSGRSMVSITHHKEKGEWMRQTVNYEGPK